MMAPTDVSNGESTANGHTVPKESTPTDAIFKDQPIENFRPMRVIVIGAGFSGIYLGIRIPQRLRNVELAIYEKNEGVGGTWFENHYPGAACDIPCWYMYMNCETVTDRSLAHSYQYTFAPNLTWSKFYAPAPEIRAYLESVVERYSAGRFIKCSHRVKSAKWDETAKKW